jgi:hypothetical protein
MQDTFNKCECSAFNELTRLTRVIDRRQGFWTKVSHSNKNMFIVKIYPCWELPWDRIQFPNEQSWQPRVLTHLFIIHRKVYPPQDSALVAMMQQWLQNTDGRTRRAWKMPLKQLACPMCQIYETSIGCTPFCDNEKTAPKIQEIQSGTYQHREHI